MVFFALKLAFYLRGAVNGPQAELGLMNCRFMRGGIRRIETCEQKTKVSSMQPSPAYPSKLKRLPERFRT